ncbi:MAG TPA: hypothetical protein VK903_13740 [Propionicimonas sp.]|nr:hypothetical protein [Propionicimonas sp.]
MKRVLLVVVLLALLVGCTVVRPVPSQDPSPSPTASQLRLDLGGGVELSVVGLDSAWTPAGQDDCAGVVHRLTTATGEYRVALLRSDCTSVPQALNGFHGYFVAPPEGAEVATATTPIGPARVFSNEYVECTNSCRSGTDEVALMAVGTRTLQVIAVAGVSRANNTRDRAQLVALLQGLRRS